LSAPDRIHDRRWFILGVLSLSLVIIGIDNTILNIALPTLQRAFDATASELQWMVDAYILVFAGLLLTMGSLGDRFGRARALALGLVVFGLGSVMAATAGSAGGLVAARAVMGIGGALIMPATLSIIVEVFPREERGQAIAVWAAVAGLGIGLGPLLGGVLLEHFFWGSVFLVNVPIVAVALGLGAFVVPDSRDPATPPVDWRGALLSMMAITSLVFAIIEAPSRGWTDVAIAGAFLLAALLGGAFVAWERRVAHPMLDLAFFRDRRFSGGIAAISVAFFALFGAVFLLPQYLQFVQGYSPLEAGVRVVPIAVGLAAGAGGSARLVERLGTTRVVASALVGLGAVLASLTLWSVDTPYPWVGLTLVALAFAMGNVMAPATDSVMGAVPEARAGVGSAMNDVTRQVGGALGVAVIGSVLNAVYTAQMTDVVAALPPVAAAAASDSVGAASRIAARIGGPTGATLAQAANGAFVAGLGIAVLVGAGVALLGATLAWRFLPAAARRPSPADSEETTSVT